VATVPPSDSIQGTIISLPLIVSAVPSLSHRRMI
jgi:hypothetical protein